MKSINEEKGITLIVLIITVVVLLILAAVSIAAVVGNNEDSAIDEAVAVTEISDTEDIKEQIWTELIMLHDDGSFSIDDIASVAKKVTGNDIDVENQTVKSPDGNTVDLSEIFDEVEITVYVEEE